MKRSRSGKGTNMPSHQTSITSYLIHRQPSTPVMFNQNSNSCSNDTNFSTLSTPSLNPDECQIVLKENKIRTLLKELQLDVKKCQHERDIGESNLTAIGKTHERLKKEEKITPTNHKKLRSMYGTATKETESEIKHLRKALDCINQIRLIQNEIRLLQHNSTVLSSPSALLNNSLTGFNNNTTLTNLNVDQTLKKPTTTMRRGVLMSLLQQAALTLPLWIGETGEAAPPLCGRTQPEPCYVCKPGDKVAAIVKNGGTTNTASSSSSKRGKAAVVEEEPEEENWILAEVVSFNSNTCKYEVDDIDAEEGLERHTLGKRRVVPLPLWRANPLTDPEAIFAKDSIVLALYPQTTCFYRGIIHESPSTPQEDYLILFEDNTYPEGYSPPLNVPQLYVVADRTSKK